MLSHTNGWTCNTGLACKSDRKGGVLKETGAVVFDGANAMSFNGGSTYFPKVPHWESNNYIDACYLSYIQTLNPVGLSSP